MGLARPCLDCAGLTRSGSRCSSCQSKRDARRGTTTERGYGADHQRRAKAAIRSEPWCSYCGHRGSPENPLTADHVIPIRVGEQEARYAWRVGAATRGAAMTWDGNLMKRGRTASVPVPGLIRRQDTSPQCGTVSLEDQGSGQPSRARGADLAGRTGQGHQRTSPQDLLCQTTRSTPPVASPPRR
jgi:hypothetical protein